MSAEEEGPKMPVAGVQSIAETLMQFKQQCDQKTLDQAQMTKILGACCGGVAQLLEKAELDRQERACDAVYSIVIAKALSSLQKPLVKAKAPAEVTELFEGVEEIAYEYLHLAKSLHKEDLQTYGYPAAVTAVIASVEKSAALKQKHQEGVVIGGPMELPHRADPKAKTEQHARESFEKAIAKVDGVLDIGGVAFREFRSDESAVMSNKFNLVITGVHGCDARIARLKKTDKIDLTDVADYCVTAATNAAPCEVVSAEILARRLTAFWRTIVSHLKKDMGREGLFFEGPILPEIHDGDAEDPKQLIERQPRIVRAIMFKAANAIKLVSLVKKDMSVATAAISISLEAMLKHFDNERVTVLRREVLIIVDEDARKAAEEEEDGRKALADDSDLQNEAEPEAEDLGNAPSTSKKRPHSSAFGGGVRRGGNTRGGAQRGGGTRGGGARGGNARKRTRRT